MHSEPHPDVQHMHRPLSKYTKMNVTARSELFANQGRDQGTRTLALRASQCFVHRELTERGIIVIVMFLFIVTIFKQRK